MFRKTTEVVESDKPKITELAFELNGFREQKVHIDDDAYVTLIHRLLKMRKGTYPSIPDMGVGISTYRFMDIDKLIAGELQEVIRDQLSTYIPQLPVENIEIYKGRYKNDFILYIDITIRTSEPKKVTFAYLQQKRAIVSSSITIERPKLINQNRGG